jgi:hypothetical protein
MERIGIQQPPCHAAVVSVDDNLSIAGEEDPGAALDTCGLAWPLGGQATVETSVGPTTGPSTTGSAR